MSLIRKHVAVLQAWACLALVTDAFRTCMKTRVGQYRISAFIIQQCYSPDGLVNPSEIGYSPDGPLTKLIKPKCPNTSHM